jgi:hypothetical protein
MRFFVLYTAVSFGFAVKAKLIQQKRSERPPNPGDLTVGLANEIDTIQMEIISKGKDGFRLI